MARGKRVQEDSQSRRVGGLLELTDGRTRGDGETEKSAETYRFKRSRK